jgi:uncharacterized protein (TIGR00255 family)
MLYSMTAFAHQAQNIAGTMIIYTIKSVNHRFLEIKFNLPETLIHLETQLREQIKHQIHRGRLEIMLQIEADTQSVEFKINSSLLKQLYHLEEELKSEHPTLIPLRVSDLIRWPGLLKISSQKLIETDLINAFQKTLTLLNRARRSEGQAIENLLERQIKKLQNSIEEIRQQYPCALTLHQEKLMMRLKKLTLELEPNRLAQEIVLLAQKMDISEELDRLTFHCQRFLEILKTSADAGKQLDFLLQELQREANTLTTKSLTPELIDHGIAMKVLIEEMREQVQNVQ